MRRFIFLAILASISFPSLASRRVSVADLHQVLVSQQAAKKADIDIAHHLNSLVLSEQLSPLTLARITNELNPGPKTIEALDLLADSSALLPPPSDEIPATPKPDMATQRIMINAAITYVAKSLHSLPDFLASRDTRSYDDSPLVIGHSGFAPLTDPHIVGTFSRVITFRNGREILDSVVLASNTKPAPQPAGLATTGEFGPVLAVILTDAAGGTVTWNRWQLVSTGTAAVFHYGVPKSASHYVVDYCCAWNSAVTAYHGTPGYHGDLVVDPTTGTILSVTLQAELSDSDVITHAGIAVDYGPVEIDGKKYTCPVHSVAISTDKNREGTNNLTSQVTRINEVKFTGYHKFGSTARIFAGSPPDEAPQASNAAVPPPTTEASATPVPPTAPQPEPATVESSAPVPAAHAESDAPASTPPTSTDFTQAEQESLLREMPVFKSNSREVVVDVVVTESNGDPVLGLTKQNFDIKEDGKPQSLDFFEEHTAKNLPQANAQPLPQLPPNVYTNAPPAPESDAVNVLLLDSLNTPKQDQSRVHLEIIDFFKKMQPGTRVAIFMLGSQLHFIQGFTTDTSVLLAKLNGMEPQKDPSFHDRSDQADDAADAQRLAMMMGPFAGAGSTAGSGARAAAQAEVANVGYGERASMTFEALNYLARYLAGVPGRKNLIWFSSTFPVVIFPNMSQRQELATLHGYLGEVKRTADLFTVSKVAVYPIGAEGVMEEHIMEADTAGPASPEGPSHTGAGGNLISPYTAGAGERAGAIAAMEQLAADTGGKAYFNTNDINGAMRRAINDGANYYTLSYSPSNKKMDGQYRRVEVHLPSGHYKLSYRRGYNADDLPAVESKPNVDPLQPLLKFGLPSQTGLLYGVRVLQASPQPDANAPRAGQNPDLKTPLTRYTVDFFIRWTDVGFDVSQQGDHTGKIQVALMAYDRDGLPLNWDSVTQSMNINPKTFDAIQKSGVPAHMEIDLPSSAAYLVTGVYDWSTGKTGTLHTHVNVATNNAAMLHKSN